MCTNMAPDKTAAMLHPAGQQADDYRCMLAQYDNKLYMDDATTLHIAEQYIHVGLATDAQLNAS